MKSKLLEKTLKRQSFDERVCDDLAEVLLQYLPLKDSIKFKGVSKQFQRTILSKCFQLDIKDGVFWAEVETREGWQQKERLDLNAFEMFLKKCPNIKLLNFRSRMSDIYQEEYNPILETIVKYCHNLIAINGLFRPNHMSVPLQRSFVDKFGKQLKSSGLSFSPMDAINCFKNLRNLTLFIDDSNSSDVCELQLPQLKTLDINIDTNLEMDAMDALSTLYRNDCIKNIEVFTINLNVYGEVLIKSVLDRISTLHNLKELGLFTGGGVNYLNNDFYGDSLRRMAINCQKLKSIRCWFVFSADGSDISQYLLPLRRFKQLRKLSLHIMRDVHGYKRQFSCKTFKDLEQLTHLRLGFMYRKDGVDDTILADIDFYLPKLQSLKILTRMKTTDWTHIILSHLTQLHTIDLNVINEDMVPIINHNLQKNCKTLRIKSI